MGGTGESGHLGEKVVGTSGEGVYSPIWPMQGRGTDRVWFLTPRALNRVLIISSLSVLIRVLTRPRQGLAARLLSIIKQSEIGDSPHPLPQKIVIKP